jgi:hypothetical protein
LIAFLRPTAGYGFKDWRYGLQWVGHKHSLFSYLIKEKWAHEITTISMPLFQLLKQITDLLQTLTFEPQKEIPPEPDGSSDLSSSPLPSGFLTITLYAPSCSAPPQDVTCPTQHILLDLITTIFGKDQIMMPLTTTV